uniref:Cornichon family AMPA receptor auxiliary protein 4 n=12 Tax=Theria TaxID=32525 RepID=A0A5F8HF16_MONDO
SAVLAGIPSAAFGRGVAWRGGPQAWAAGSPKLGAERVRAGKVGGPPRNRGARGPGTPSRARRTGGQGWVCRAQELWEPLLRFCYSGLCWGDWGVSPAGPPSCPSQRCSSAEDDSLPWSVPPRSSWRKWVVPELIGHTIVTVLMLISLHWFIFLLNLPVATWNIYRFIMVPSGNMGVFDPTEIHNRGQLKSHMKEAMIKLGFHLLCFFMYLYSMILALIND